MAPERPDSIVRHFYYTPAAADNACRFLISTHYTNYNPWLFAINITALIFTLIPKLPQVRSTTIVPRARILTPFSCIVNESTSWTMICRAWRRRLPRRDHRRPLPPMHPSSP